MSGELLAGAQTVYIGGIYEEHSDETYVKYYSAFGRRIAMRDSAGVVHYILADHLGSSTVVTDSSGGDIRTMKYYPYGAERSSTGDVLTDKLFTGQQREPAAVSALGLYNYGARFYSTLTGRFISADPVVPTPSDPQTLNRYSYVRNNPLIFVDPSGLCFTWMGKTFECDPDKLKEWWDWAFNRKDWWGGLARWGIQQQEFWQNFWRFYIDSPNELVPLKTLHTFVEALEQSPSAWNTMPEMGWIAFGGVFNVLPNFFKWSLLGLMEGPQWIDVIPEEDYIGGDTWWYEESRAGPWALVETSGEWRELQEHFPYREQVHQRFIDRTKDIADSMGDRVSQVKLRWSLTQYEILIGAGYHPPRRSKDRNEITNEVGECIIGGDCLNIVSTLDPYPY